MREVWVTGIGMVSAVGSGPRAHLDAAVAGRSGLTRHTFFGGSAPDPVMCGMIPADVLTQDLDATAATRGDQILEIAARQAIESSTFPNLESLDLIAGTTLGNLHGGTQYYRAARAGAITDTNLVKHFLTCAPAAHVARALGIGGRRLTISSACGSGTAAVGAAYNRVRSGEADAVLAAGVDALSPFVVAGFNSLRLVSSRECRPFDRDRDGLNPGEGCGVLLLESADTARSRGARALARITGFGEALDAYHHTRSHPEGNALVVAAGKALAGVHGGATAIDHVHLHGTGTQANDMSEYAACKRLFGERLGLIPMCSTKSMTGHTFGGAGALSAAFCVLTIAHGVVPPTVFLENPDPTFEGLSVSVAARTGVHCRSALSLALGFGGEAFALSLAAPQGDSP